MAFFLPSSPLKRYRKCDRCGLKTPEKVENCQRCHGLDEAGLRELINSWKEKSHAHKELGFGFLVIGALVICMMLLVFLE
jgi:hypothetical protein